MAEAEKLPTESPSDATDANFEVVKGAEVRDPNFYYLTKPINVEGRELYTIRINSKGVIGGREWFEILRDWKRKYPEEARTANPLHRYMEEGYLSLVIAKCNKFAPEDLYKIDPEELPNLFTEARVFQYSGATRQSTE